MIQITYLKAFQATAFPTSGLGLQSNFRLPQEAKQPRFQPI